MPHPHNHHYHCDQKSWDSQQAAAVAESQSLVEDPVRASQGVSLETLSFSGPVDLRIQINYR